MNTANTQEILPLQPKEVTPGRLLIYSLTSAAHTGPAQKKNDSETAMPLKID